jgi:hypothetical protein
LFSGSIGHPLFRKITAGSFSFKNQLTGIRYPDGSAYGFEYTAAEPFRDDGERLIRNPLEPFRDDGERLIIIG